MKCYFCISKYTRMLEYDISPAVEAFSTNIADSTDFDVVLPLHQSHGTESIIVNTADDVNRTFGVDALITQTPGLRIGVKTADCVPVLLHDGATRTVAAIHSGWKGTLADIIGATVGRMTAECGVAPANISAVIGPCIHIEAFEVGDDVRDLFQEAGFGDFCRRLPRFGAADGEKWHIDLPSICRRELVRAGVRTIDVRPECTYTLHRQFYSARRLGPAFQKQRILSCIMLRQINNPILH